MRWFLDVAVYSVFGRGRKFGCSCGADSRICKPSRRDCGGRTRLRPRDLNALGEVNVVLPTRIRLRDVYGAIGGHDRHAASIGIGALSLMMIWLRCVASRES